MSKFNFFTDRGWLEVPWTALRDVRLSPTDFTTSSKRNGNVFYLAYGFDSDKFLNAWKNTFGEAEIVNIHDTTVQIHYYPAIR